MSTNCSLTEAHLETLRIRGNVVEVFRNPSRKEYQQLCQPYTECRIWLMGDDALAWNINVLHAEIHDALGLDNTCIPIHMAGKYGADEAYARVTDASQRTIWFHNPTVARVISNHRWLTRAFPNDIIVGFFDEDVVGNWEELDRTDLREATMGSEIDLHRAYEVFRKSYEEETGASWTEEKFVSRARQWVFYGDENGFVTIRRQRSGMNKLVGVAGDLRSILRGLTELQQINEPLWGAVSAPLAQMAQKRGLIVPHLYTGGALLIRALMAMVPASVFGGEKPAIRKDGGLEFDFHDTGTAVKYLIGNKAYFQKMLLVPEVKEKLKSIPGAAMVLRLLGLSMKSVDVNDASP